ncbi:MAG TPA: hypothetical protein VIX89_04670 [Bryobacteraceae bacterium]
MGIHDMSIHNPLVSLILTEQILNLIQESGASQLEAACAIEAVRNLLPSLLALPSLPPHTDGESA